MLTFLFAFVLALVVVLALLISGLYFAMWAVGSGLALRLGLAIRNRRWLRRLAPDFVLLAALKMTPIGGGMGNLLVGGPNLFGGTGVPTDAALGGAPANGDIYFRIDGGAATTIYQRRAAVWVATGA